MVVSNEESCHGVLAAVMSIEEGCHGNVCACSSGVE